jgi:hypothetical protein
MRTVFFMCYFCGAFNFVKWIAFFERDTSTAIGRVFYKFCEITSAAVDFWILWALCVVSIIILALLMVSKNVSISKGIAPTALNLVSAVLYWFLHMN